MATGDFLRALYDDKDVTWYNDRDNRIGSREFIFEDGELKVVALDRDGLTLAVAREYRSSGKPPHVECKDRDGNVLWRAYVEFNIISDPNIAIYVHGSKEKEIFVSQSRMEALLEDYWREIGRIPDSKKEDAAKKTEKKEKKIEKKVEKKQQDPPGFGGGGGGGFGAGEVTSASSGLVPAILCVCVFLGVILNVVFSNIYYRLDEIKHYASIVCVYASCPFMVLLYLILCRPGRKSPKSRRFFWFVHLLMYTAGFAFLAYLHSFIYFNKDINILLPNVTDETMGGLFHFLLCFAPVLVYGVVSGIWTLIREKTTGDWVCVEISFKSMLMLHAGSAFFILVTQLVMIFMSYRPGDIGMIITTTLVIPFLGLLIFLASTIAKLPYKLMSMRF